MEFEQLVHFLAVAEHGSFTRAAKEVALSQPALSRSIAKLEDELGQPVFERQSRKVVLTDAGRLLRPRARQVIDIVARTKAEITDDGKTGTLRVGAIPTIAPYLIPEILEAFSQVAPEAKIEVTEDVTDALLPACSNGAVDVALLALPLEARYLEVEPLFEDELLLVVPPHHAFATQDVVRLEDLRAHPFVLLNEAHCLSDNVVHSCRSQSVDPISIERTNQLAMVLELVALGHGVSLIPAMAGRIDESPRRVYRRLASSPSRTIALVWNRYRFRTKLLERLLEVIRDMGTRRSSTQSSNASPATRPR